MYGCLSVCVCVCVWIISAWALQIVCLYLQVPIMDVAGRRPLLLYPMMCMIVILGAITAALKFQVFSAIYLLCFSSDHFFRVI